MNSATCKKGVRIGEKIVMKQDIVNKDKFGNVCLLKKGSAGYATNYGSMIFENGEIIKDFIKDNCIDGIDKPSLTAYLYRSLSENLPLKKMLDSYEITEEEFQKAILDELNSFYINDDEVDQCDKEAVYEEFDINGEIDKFEMTSIIYHALYDEFPMQKMLKSCKISNAVFEQNIINALNKIILNSDELPEKMKIFVM